MKWDGNMEEKKEIKIEGFDDRNIKMQMEIILKKSREKRKLNTDFLNLLVNRINMKKAKKFVMTRVIRISPFFM